MSTIPDYIPLGKPYKQRTRGKATKKWYQRYRLNNDPVRKVRSAPCSIDRSVAMRRRDHFIQEHVKKSLNLSGEPTNLPQFVETYRIYLDGEDCCPDHVARTVTRIKAILEGCRIRSHQDVDVIKIKAWLTKQRNNGKFGRRTATYYLKAIKAFTRFLARHGRISIDPLAYFVVKVKGEIENTRPRRAATEKEFAALLKAASSGVSYRDMSGRQRMYVYLIAANTGFRAQELASLTPASFQLDADTPIVTVRCTISKRRKLDLQPITPELAELLRPFLPEFDADQSLFPGTWYLRAAEMLRTDLESAKVKYEKGGEVFDFHALRHTFVIRVAMTGAPMSVVQEICRLSTPALVERYFHNNGKYNGVFAKLPKLPEQPK